MISPLQVLDRDVASSGKGFYVWFARDWVETLILERDELMRFLCAVGRGDVGVEAEVDDVEY